MFGECAKYIFMSTGGFFFPFLFWKRVNVETCFLPRSNSVQHGWSAVSTKREYKVFWELCTTGAKRSASKISFQVKFGNNKNNATQGDYGWACLTLFTCDFAP